MKSKSGFGKVLLWILCILLVLFTAVEVVGYYQFQPVSSKDTQTQDFTIEEGEGMGQVLDNLQKDGLIRSADVTKLFVRLTRKADFYAGTFKLSPSMSTTDILQYIADPNHIEQTALVLTIPEGTWAKEVAASIASLYPSISQEQVLAKWNDQSYIEELAKDYSFLDPATLSNADLKVKLEGYLLPDTYHLNKDMDINAITRMILDQFKAVWDENKAAFDASGMSPEQIVTLASIIQFESGHAEDMPNISSVFHNRLAAGMDLQSSVTVCYALYENFDNAQACETNYDIDSPYNTYRNSGLPVGPVCNPGRAALLAAVQPADTDYMFFAADINNVVDGKVHYSVTDEEHQQTLHDLKLLLGGENEEAAGGE